jgi:hypothetical protein
MQWSNQLKGSKWNKVLIIKKPSEKLDESNKPRHVKIALIHKIKEYQLEICWDLNLKEELF